MEAAWGRLGKWLFLQRRRSERATFIKASVLRAYNASQACSLRCSRRCWSIHVPLCSLPHGVNCTQRGRAVQRHQRFRAARRRCLRLLWRRCQSSLSFSFRGFLFRVLRGNPRGAGGGGLGEKLAVLGGAATCRSPSEQPRLLALLSGFHESVCLAGRGATLRLL